MLAYRIADGRHAIFDFTGAMLHGGRWNSIGKPVIYAAETFAGAMLEILVHANLSHTPRNHQVVRIEIPDEVVVETLMPDRLKDWDAENLIASQAFGDAWIKEQRSAVLRVPSIITQGREHNLIINVQHHEFHLIRAGAAEPVQWDSRLFPGSRLTPPKPR